MTKSLSNTFRLVCAALALATAAVGCGDDDDQQIPAQLEVDASAIPNTKLVVSGACPSVPACGAGTVAQVTQLSNGCLQITCRPGSRASDAGAR